MAGAAGRRGAGPRDSAAAVARGADRRPHCVGNRRRSRLYRQEPVRRGLIDAATNHALAARGRGVAERTAAMTDYDERKDHKEREIARTRGELSLTLAALERKLAA